MSEYATWYDTFVSKPRDKAKEGASNDTNNK